MLVSGRKPRPTALENIKLTRKNGYAMSRGQTQRGKGAIAIPFSTDDEKGVQLSIAIGGEYSVLDDQEEKFLSPATRHC